ncbi:hypothetical protein GmHk_01G000852 [Glycine max]|nr:hypothetical protein GmHk_01G000852 [Glycine max]
MTPPKCARSGPLVKVKAEHHRRINSEGDVGPRLVRSNGMRREWSLKDLAGQQQDKGVLGTSNSTIDSRDLQKIIKICYDILYKV